MKIRISVVVFTGLVAGASWSAIPACIIPDYCIELQYPGRDWCRALEGAKMWPNGQPESASNVVNEYGGPPEGCLCFNDADQTILGDQTPIEQYEYLGDLITDSAREACAAVVPLGYDHNCFDVDGPDAPVPSIIITGDLTHDCVGSCVQINPPPNGGCEEKNPYECNDSGYGYTSANDEVESGSGAETDSSSGGSSDTEIIQTPGSIDRG